MTADKVREVLVIYKKKFEEMGIPKDKCPHGSFTTPNNSSLVHCDEMLNEMAVFIQEGRMEKTFRWLGFIQGCLWISGVYTLKELQNHNRPQNDEK